MKLTSVAGCVLATLLATAPAPAQTVAELLQKGIFAQETEGNLDNAILIFRQIVNSATTQRDVAAQAQYRLAQTLLQKGDLSLAAQEFNKLARDYSDYQNLVSSMATQGRRAIVPPGTAGGLGGRSGGPPVDAAKLAEMRAAEERMKATTAALALAQFDGGPSVSVTGKVSQIVFMNPLSRLVLETPGGAKYTFVTAGPNAMLSQGFTRTALKMGDEVTVYGMLARDGRKLDDGSLAGRAMTVALPNGTLLFDQAKVPNEQVYGQQKGK